jgi:hypothetical protein
MMHDQDLPTSLWAEATRTAVYIQNRSPHSILGEKTPEEVFSGEKPDVGHLRIFECPSLHPCSKREENQDGTLRQERNFCRVQRNF